MTCQFGSLTAVVVRIAFLFAERFLFFGVDLLGKEFFSKRLLKIAAKRKTLKLAAGSGVFGKQQKSKLLEVERKETLDAKTSQREVDCLSFHKYKVLVIVPSVEASHNSLDILESSITDNL